MTRGLLLCALLAGCALDPFTIRPGEKDGGGLPGRDGGGDGDGGMGGIDAEPVCVPSGPDDTCDEIDNDCNGVKDDGFDKLTDDDNCGVCGNRCISPGAIEDCIAGACEFVMCQPGFKDLDSGVAGCEYLCPVFPEQPEDCNAVDDDCDGEADEPAELPAPPAGLCRTTAGTPCAAVSMVCDTRGASAFTTWFCAYPPEVEFNPDVPNGIVLDETLCDGEDGDCDAVADDPFPDLGQECDNGELGICRDGGVRACDPGDPGQTICDLSVAPDPLGSSVAEACNGLDDNCDGTIDNPTGPDRVVDDMVHVTHSGLDFFIYRYEASRPDATVASEGVSSARSCSRADTVPWGGITFGSAEAACAVSGKRLCSAAEFQAACGGAGGATYPYGGSFDADACNAEPFDGVPGGGDDDIALPTGNAALAMCVSADAVHDLSGNLKEWTDDVRGTTGGADPVDIIVLRGGAFDTPAIGATCSFDTSRLPANAVVDTVGFRCCSGSAP